MACTNSTITLDPAALERLVTDPEGVLRDEERFWTDYRAQVLTRRWAEAVGYEISYDSWRSQVKAWAETPEEERRKHPLVRNCEAIVAAGESFARRALPHIRSFVLPGADLSCTVRFTAFIPARAFAVEDVVFNVAARYWHDNPANILNQMVHEVGHVGHSRCREMGREDDCPDKAVSSVLQNLQAEGFCTYIAYRAQHLYPAPDEVDFKLADDPAAVDRLFADLNEVFAQARGGSLTEAEFGNLSWEKGVMGRAFYIPGMHMCKAIDERLGRDALIQSMLDGPSAWVRLYGTIAPAGHRLIGIK